MTGSAPADPRGAGRAAGFSETPVVRMLIPDDVELGSADLIRGSGLGAST